ncbi:ISSth1, transposase (orf1), IS3 family [Streptococcus pyogenes]|nr:ISSth1, transposase (orf1), IS3 family [Streptococcus pyogenes]
MTSALFGIFMCKKETFTPYEKEEACIDYINGTRSRAEICSCLRIFIRTIQDWTAVYMKYEKTAALYDVSYSQVYSWVKKNYLTKEVITKQMMSLMN